MCSQNEIRLERTDRSYRSTLLLHGGGGDERDWTQLSELMRGDVPKFDPIGALDLPGHGKATTPSEACNVLAHDNSELDQFQQRVRRLGGKALLRRSYEGGTFLTGTNR